MGDLQRALTLVLEEKCDICGRIRRSDNVFRECKCVLAKLYDDEEIATIKEQFKQFQHIVMIIEANPLHGLQPSHAVTFVKTVSNMNPNAQRMLRHFNSKKVYTLLHALTYLVIKGTCAYSYEAHQMFYNMTPKTARILKFPVCIYREDENTICLLQAEREVCYKHMMMFYIAHMELSAILPAEVVKTCLYYLLVEYDDIVGCTPVVS
jgi:hypothetical protein